MSGRRGAGSIGATRHVVTLDCPDAAALAAFYADLLGWRAQPLEAGAATEWVDVLPPEGSGAGFAIGCQRIDDYRAPSWPSNEVPQQAHLDLYVASIEESARHAEAVGAVRHAYQPSEDGSFVVFLDPAGHPFCLCRE